MYATVAEIKTNIADMVRTQCRIAEHSRQGWDDKDITKIERDIHKAEVTIRRLQHSQKKAARVILAAASSCAFCRGNGCGQCQYTGIA